MKAALITPFTSHLPFHPGSYLGYGAAVLKEIHRVDVIDQNAELYFRHRTRLSELFHQVDIAPVAYDQPFLYPLNLRLMDELEESLRQIPWKEYHSVFVTAPSWFVTVPTEEILRLSRHIRSESPRCKVFFFGNSLGSWTDEDELRRNDVRIRHLNCLDKPDSVNRPVDYDSLPTPWYESRHKYLFDILPFRLKHGCSWGKCRFCSLAKGWNSGYRERSAGNVIRELEELIDRYDPQMFVCRDNAVNGENLIEFCHAFEKFKKPWAGMARADLSDREIEAMEKSRCRFLYFGLESGSDRILKILNKGIDARRMSRFVRALYDHGIMPAPSVFVGSPDEREEDFEETVGFVLEHRDYFRVVNVYPFMMSPNSEFTRKGKSPHGDTRERLKTLIDVCVDSGLKVCVGEQFAEYVLFKTSLSPT